nr:alpha/beta hydrolase [Nakamurella flavida]
MTRHVVDTPTGPVRVHVYRPRTATGPLPLHLFVHGGGFWLGSVDELVVDATCRERAAAADCVVVAVDYRLAPEHPFPTPFDDCLAALLWVHAHAADLGGDPDVLTIGGVSAGATLAAAVALAARDRGGPAIALQVLEVPALDLTLDSMRASGVGDEYGITVADMRAGMELYLPDPDGATDPRASPLHAADVAGLPPTRVMTAECDPLRHEGELFAARLRAAGVTVEHHRYPGAVHGSLALTGTWEPARTWRADVLTALHRAHHPAPVAGA